MATGDEPLNPLPPREGPSPADEPPAVALREPPELLAHARGLGIRAEELPALLDFLVVVCLVVGWGGAGCAPVLRGCTHGHARPLIVGVARLEDADTGEPLAGVPVFGVSAWQLRRLPEEGGDWAAWVAENRDVAWVIEATSSGADIEAMAMAMAMARGGRTDASGRVAIPLRLMHTVHDRWLYTIHRRQPPSSALAALWVVWPGPEAKRLVRIEGATWRPDVVEEDAAAIGDALGEDVKGTLDLGVLRVP